MTYRHYVVHEYGGREVLQLEESEIPTPGPNEVGIRIRAAGVAFGDIFRQAGVAPGGPKPPYTPGYDVVGVVDRRGEQVTSVEIGQIVAALPAAMHYGGYAEYIVLPADRVVPLPGGLDPAEIACLTLNYVTAYQVLVRVAHAEAGQRALIHGAAGGAGSAMLEVGRELGLDVYGTASAPKHDLVRNLGAIPIDYRSEDFVERVMTLTGDGVDMAVDPIGGRHYKRSFSVLRRGGTLVATGAYNASVGRAGQLETMTGFMRLPLWNALPNGRSATLYACEGLNKKRPDFYADDLTMLVGWLAGGRIKPVIARRMRLEEAPQAQQLLIEAGVRGKIVLIMGE